MELQGLLSQTPRRIRPAMHPCQPCKRLKRRCDRELPECSLCIRTHRPCEYPPGSMPASPAETQSQSPQSILLDVPINRFPATYFFDRQAFNHCHMSIERSHLPPSSVVLNGLRNTDEIRQVAHKYFTSVHLWFPIINRNKFYGSFLHGSFEADVEISLLALCMQILASRPSNGTQVLDTGYISIKQAFVQLEQAGVLNVTVLQALLLTALYEIGHGIYPAAYLTIGNCARYAVALDLDREILNWNHNAPDWVIVEEKHRAWWAVLMLDRYINISCPRRALCTPDPIERQYLPMADDDWNQGTQLSGPPHKLSTPVEVKMGKFARLAQATHLLGRVLRHIRDPTTDKGFLSEEREALDRALRSLLSLTVAEEMAGTDTAFCSPMALLGSAILTLHSESSGELSNTMAESPVEAHRKSYDMAIDINSQVVLPIARRIQDCWPTAPRHPSPIVLDWMYRCIVACNIFHKENDSLLYEGCIEDAREAMKLLSHQWAIGDLYFKLLDME